MSSAARLLKRFARSLCVVLLVVIGSVALVRRAPGYLSDAGEMDARYADVARAKVAAEAARSTSISRILSTEIAGWLRGNLGLSRQYDVPVEELIRPRLAITGNLILRGILFAWGLALSAAILSSSSRKATLLWQLPATILLAVPTSAMATLCLLGDSGGPVLVMTLLLASRDFKFLDHLLRRVWRDPHLLQARAQGIRPRRLLWAHILPSVTPHLAALATLSILTALGALVPVEVIFNVPGLGQLAWNAALNRDLPVLLAITMIMALAVTCAGMLSEKPAALKAV